MKTAPVDEQTFRGAMRELAGGVAFVTTRLGARRAGCLVTSLISYALDPPTVLLTLSRDNSTAQLLGESAAFGVSLLSAHQLDALRGLSVASAGEARFAHTRWREASPGGQWIAEDSLAAFECEVEERISRHTHLIVLGRVVALHPADPGQASPLVYWRREYRVLR